MEGKIAIITGAARGMGAAHARRLHSEGAIVVATDIREEEGRALAEECGANFAFLQHDVADRGRWDDIVRETEDRFGPVSILVNNAGIPSFETLESASVDAYRRVIEINQFSIFYGMQAIVPSMRRAGGGTIINVSSTLGMIAAPGVFPYVASKWAIRGMTKAAALELAADRIRVNSVHPGAIETPAFLEAVGSDPGAMDALVGGGKVPFARVAAADEVSGIVAFLASDDSSYCTGCEYVVDGGLTAQ